MPTMRAISLAPQESKRLCWALVGSMFLTATSATRSQHESRAPLGVSVDPTCWQAVVSVPPMIRRLRLDNAVVDRTAAVSAEVQDSPNKHMVRVPQYTDFINAYGLTLFLWPASPVSSMPTTNPTERSASRVSTSILTTTSQLLLNRMTSPAARTSASCIWSEIQPLPRAFSVTWSSLTTISTTGMKSSGD